MQTVYCYIEDVAIENDEGRIVAGVQARCSECGHTTESYGQSNNSILRCLRLLRSECPRQQTNYYVEGATDRGIVRTVKKVEEPQNPKLTVTYEFEILWAQADIVESLTQGLVASQWARLFNERLPSDEDAVQTIIKKDEVIRWFKVRSHPSHYAMIVSSGSARVIGLVKETNAARI